MNLQGLLDKLKSHSSYNDSGMILIHKGIVRNTSRDGKKVKSLSIEVDYEKVNSIIEKNKKRRGIFEILIEIREGKNIPVGEDLMYLVVMGDIRDNVIPALENTLNQIKTEASIKYENYIE